MRPLPATLAALILVTAAATSRAEPPFARVPPGSIVRVSAGALHAPVRGTLVSASPDTLHVMPEHGGAIVDVATRNVRSLDYLAGRRPSPRKDIMLGLGLGVAGGAVLGAALSGQNGGEGGGGGGEGEGEGGGGGSVTPSETVQPGASATYRAIVGAVFGGAVGGLLGGLVHFGMEEDLWTTVAGPGPVSRALGVPATATPPLFAVRVPLRFGRARR